MLKRDELANLNSCLNKAADDEPLFILRAQDKLAPATVRMWAHWAQRGSVSAEKIGEAYKLAGAMEAWPNRKMPD